MAGRSFRKDNFQPGNNNQFKASGKNRDYYTFDAFPGVGAYATGGTIVNGGDGYIYHVFLSSGTFTVTQPPAYINSVDYLIIAGGGAGGAGLRDTIGGGGGGAGGLRRGSIGISQTSYPVAIGAGASANIGPQPSATRTGSNSSAFGITANGGGGGGSYPFPGIDVTAIVAGAPGGSGGGASFNGYNKGTSTSTVPRQGTSGGITNTPLYGYATPTTRVAGGGGGAGGNANQSLITVQPYAPHGSGGIGLSIPEFPAAIVGLALPTEQYSSWYPQVNPQGYAKGGTGLISSSTVAASPGLANTGNGGPGVNHPAPTVPTGVGSSGGSGIVVVRYLKKTTPTQRATGGTIEPSTDPNHPGVFRHIFTTPGTFTVTDPTLTSVEILAVAGGGGGGCGFYNFGGGGGAGGFFSTIHNVDNGIYAFAPWQSNIDVVTGKPYPVSATAYPVVVGAGGAMGPGNAPGIGSNGGNTTFGSPGPMQIIVIGGGGGGASDDNFSPFVAYPGQPGGSGGGTGKAANQPIAPPLGSLFEGNAAHPVYTDLAGTQGQKGSNVNTPTPVHGSGGGGGASTAGGPSPPAPLTGGGGGSGWYSVIAPPTYGTPGPIAGYRYFAGGGGGTGAGPGLAAGIGGSGGGGNGKVFGGSGTNDMNGTANTGGGGGGGASSHGSGGSGILIIQYPE